ncbi:NADPH-dependent FMN reductase [Streptomyces cyaneofuscatus]|uniref:NADPH-dependent FMN reductase n=1 Tax=Streptomyces cyaneofuscatus TaxID=66883 RepID=UPI00369E0855
MPHEPLHVAVLIGSGRKGRSGATVARWFTEQARRRGDIGVDLVDLADYPLPGEPVPQPSPETELLLHDLSPRLTKADMFVIITPEYNHSFPATLKAAIDWHDREWQAKPVGFVSYGGRSGGLRAVEQLRQVFPELHAVTVRDTVSFHGVWDHFDTDGNPRDPSACNAAAHTMLDQLAWWGNVLREGRAAHPYHHGTQHQLATTSAGAS